MWVAWDGFLPSVMHSNKHWTMPPASFTITASFFRYQSWTVLTVCEQIRQVQNIVLVQLIHCWYQQHQQVNAFTSYYISVQVNDTINKTPLGSHTLLSVPKTAPARSTGRCRNWSTRSSTETRDGQSTLRLE